MKNAFVTTKILPLGHNHCTTYLPQVLGCMATGHCSTAHYSETPVVRKMSHWTGSPFVRQPVNPQTKACCTEGLLL